MEPCIDELREKGVKYALHLMRDAKNSGVNRAMNLPQFNTPNMHDTVVDDFDL